MATASVWLMLVVLKGAFGAVLGLMLLATACRGTATSPRLTKAEDDVERWRQESKSIVDRFVVSHDFELADEFFDGDSYVRRYVGTLPQELIVRLPAGYVRQSLEGYENFEGGLGWKVVEIWGGPSLGHDGECLVAIEVMTDRRLMVLAPEEHRSAVLRGVLHFIQLVSSCSPD